MNVNSKKIHLLNELFNDIEEEWRNIIKEKTNYNDVLFNHLLEDISDYFEKWRYYYELPQDERKAEFSFLRNFTIVLMSVAHSKYNYEKGYMDKIPKTDLKLINKYFN